MLPFFWEQVWRTKVDGNAEMKTLIIHRTGQREPYTLNLDVDLRFFRLERIHGQFHQELLITLVALNSEVSFKSRLLLI